MPESLKSKTVSGVLWSAIERFSLQGVQFVINIIMADYSYHQIMV